MKCSYGTGSAPEARNQTLRFSVQPFFDKQPTFFTFTAPNLTQTAAAGILRLSVKGELPPTGG